MTALLLAGLVLGPISFGLMAWKAPGDLPRNLIVFVGAVLVMAAGALTASSGPFTYSPAGWAPWGAWLSFFLELVVGLAIIYLGRRVRSFLVVVLGTIHLGLILIEEYLRLQAPVLNAPPRFVLDHLSLILVLIICFVGSLIVIYAIGYMKEHAHHAPATAAGPGRFFLFLLGFLGVMNGLVLADTIQWLGLFWELTTICSVMLIKYDGTEEAVANARRALVIGTFGGLANMAASLLCLSAHGTTTLSGAMAGGSQLVMAFFCLGALTKSAQIPFQSWLLGAMIAPTPVSALLHSATMVKAGSYMVLRLAPAFAETKLMAALALVGAFTFALASALAIGQSNSKKVLAYSTIANLGLIVTCAGIDSPLAYAAALMVLCFHAASKGLLFLCVGTIEQAIGSRDIEDMGGIRFLLPATTIITLIGMASMLIPPFGMLLSKWMAIEAAIRQPFILMLLVAGSALTVVFWVKWMGRIHTVSFHQEERFEKLAPSKFWTMAILAAVVLLSGVAAIPIHKWVFDPLAVAQYAGRLPGAVAAQSLAQMASIRQLIAWPIFLFLGLGILGWIASRMRIKARHVRLPFLCGENIEEEGKFYSFRGFRDQQDTAWAANVYLTPIFQEGPITLWANLLAALFILSMFAVTGIV